MSSRDVAISIRGLSKSYTLAHNAPKHDSLRQAAAGWLRGPRRRAGRETFWALKDVDLEVR